MTDPDVFLTGPLPAAGLERLHEARLTTRAWEGPSERRPSAGELAAAVGGARVLVSLLTDPIDAEVIAAAPALAGIANYAVGYDNVDIDAATRRGIPVTNTPDVLTETTADLAFALLLAITRNVVRGDAFMRAGRFRFWSPDLMLGQDVSRGGSGRRKVLGIVGFGRIGAAVARRARGFDLEVLAADPRGHDRIQRSDGVEAAALEELLERSDFVTLHAPLRDDTRHMIGAAQLARMKPTACLINTARGALVDEAALVAALERGALAGAGLDVYEHEPVMAAGLAELDNVVLLPHLGSATRGTRNRMAEIAADNAVSIARGDRPPNCVNPEIYDDPDATDAAAGRT